MRGFNELVYVALAEMIEYTAACQSALRGASPKASEPLKKARAGHKS